jgi:hypothetical protein
MGLAGNLAADARLEAARAGGADELVWGATILVGPATAFSLDRLDRRGHLTPTRTHVNPAQHQFVSTPSEAVKQRA